MKRAMWRQQLSVCLAVVAMLPYVAWADPSGNGDVSQVLRGGTFAGPASGAQQVFLTTDPITFEATPWDRNVACTGIAPTFVQVFVFTSEGELAASFDASNQAFGGPVSNYRLLFVKASIYLTNTPHGSLISIERG